MYLREFIFIDKCKYVKWLLYYQIIGTASNNFNI